MKNTVEIIGTPWSMSDLLIEVAETWIKENFGIEALHEMPNEEFEMVENLVMEGQIRYKIIKQA